MPTYDYECQKCGHRFEKFQGINDPVLKTCPECRSRKLKRLIGTGAGLIFKGSGFYATDYRSQGYKEAAKSERAGNGASEKTPKAEKEAKAEKPAKQAKETGKNASK